MERRRWNFAEILIKKVSILMAILISRLVKSNKKKKALNLTVKKELEVISQLPTGKKADVSFNTKISEKINEFIMKYNKLLTYISLHRAAIKSFLLLILWFIAFVSIFVPKTIITTFSTCSSFGETGNESFKEK